MQIDSSNDDDTGSCCSQSGFPPSDSLTLERIRSRQKFVNALALQTTLSFELLQTRDTEQNAHSMMPIDQEMDVCPLDDAWFPPEDNGASLKYSEHSRAQHNMCRSCNAITA